MPPDSRTPIEVLMVEDSDDDARLLKRQLETAGYGVNLERVDTGDALTSALARKRWDIVFSDFSMPQFDGTAALRIVREHDRDLPFIILSGTIGEERAVQLMKMGAQDYVIKGNVRRLVPAIERELKESKLRREHRLAQEHIQHLAYYDSLTHLPNRHRLLEDVQAHLDRAAPIALMIVNLVNFREVNGALGYPNGDGLICEAAGRLQQLNPPQGNVYRLHGSEFAVLLQTDNRAEIEAIVQTAIKLLTPHYYLSAGFRVHIAVRVGVAFSAGHHMEASVLLQRADMAGAMAKGDGKSYAWYEAERDPSNPQRLALLADLHDALRSNQLFLVFQPKVDCRTGAVTGSEALLRWSHPEHGVVMPDAFIGMAERSGLIDDIARNVVAQTAQQIKTWRAQGLVLPVAINLSAKNLLNAQLMAELLGAAKQNGSGASQIEIEITETALMADPDRAMVALRRLYENGVRIYIDDFGTGFSSLGYLKKLPIHAIKIDKSFVLDLVRNPDSETIVRSTVGLAHNLGLKVVAEGVENRATWERLITYGCDEGQGYYFAKPLAPEEFASTFRAGKQPKSSR